LVGLPAKQVFQVASVRYITGLSYGNPVIYYRQRRGTSIEQPVNFDSAIPLNAKPEPFTRDPRLATKDMRVYWATIIQFTFR